jgi:phosphomannomutase
MAGIFKAYDIRGVVGEALNAERAYWIGRALASELFGAQSPIVVTRDMRTHSPEIAASLMRGLTEGGCDMIDVGLAATPMNYWANVHFNAAGSVQVTASHNGPEYNGFKVSGPDATPRDFVTGLDKVEAFVLRAENGDAPASQKNGSVTQVEGALEKYLDFMAQFVNENTAPRTVKVAIDAANGMAGSFLPAFVERFSWIEAVPLYWELDGTFPNHEADPLKAENLRDVQEKTRAAGCDIGVAFDGDADRCMFVDEKGDIVTSDLITALIAGDVLQNHRGAAVLYDLRSSQIVPEWIEKHGGVPVRGRVGHSFMKRLLREKNAPFGGELSGHYYFADCFNTDSGLMALIQILNIWRQAQGEKPTPFSQIVAPLRKYRATGEINYRVADAKAVQAKIEEHYAAQGAQCDHLDGLTVQFGDWWFNLRSSNTEPLLRLNLEAATAEQRDARLHEVESLIGSAPVAGH